MKKIGVVGLYSIRNMGDRIICDCTQYLMDSKNNNIEIVEVDAVPRKRSSYKGINFIRYTIAVFMIRFLGPKLFKPTSSSKARYRFEYFAWRLRLGSYYKKALVGLDAILFSGGGFLKFKTQGLNYYVEQIIKIADKNNIPVMMSGVGIEGYDENDIRCQKLKQAINSDCVKTITTRDYVDILQKNYIYNEKVVTARVGDPAIWVPQCYDIQKSETSNLIGINVIRGNVYRDYGNKLDYDGLKSFYKGLIKECKRRKLNWVLFSNGMKGDQQFGREILQELNMPVKGNLLPAPKSSKGLVEMVSQFKYILAARLHACITAYSLDIPVIGLIWNEKTEMFAQLIGKPENFYKEDQLNEVDIVDSLEQCISKNYDDNIRQELKAITKKHIINFVNDLNRG